MPAAGYTLATMIAGVQSDLGDTSGEYYTTAYITGRINDRMADFCLRT